MDIQPSPIKTTVQQAPHEQPVIRDPFQEEESKEDDIAEGTFLMVGPQPQDEVDLLDLVEVAQIVSSDSDEEQI